jgi:hypothetical protein
MIPFHLPAWVLAAAGLFGVAVFIREICQIISDYRYTQRLLRRQQILRRIYQDHTLPSPSQVVDFHVARKDRC